MKVSARVYGALAVALSLSLATSRAATPAAEAPPVMPPPTDAASADAVSADVPQAVAPPSDASRKSGDSMYVIDQLVVGVNNAPGGAADRVATIKSGDRVEVLGRDGDDTRIQLGNGTTGWVKSSYLSSEQPLQRRLQDRTAEVEKLKQDIGRLQSQLTAAGTAASRDASATGAPAHGAAATARSGAEPTAGGASAGGASAFGTPAVGGTAAKNEAAPTVAAVRDASFFMTAPDQVPRFPWQWLLGAFVLALPIGFFAGWRVLDRRIRRKYGGLRIY